MMARYCYQIHTHRDPQQVYRLVDAIHATSSDSLVVISHTHDGAPLDVGRLCRNGESLVHLTAGGYADWSHVRRYLEIVSLLRERGADYTWMINLTGQDYPVRPLRDAEAELEDCGHDGFVEYFPVLSSASPWGTALGRTRYWFHHRTLRPLSTAAKHRLRPLQVVNRLQPLFRLNLSRGLTVGWRARTPYGPQLICYGGSAYASVRRECAEYALHTAERAPQVVRHYERTLSPAESYLQTVWFGAQRFTFANDCKRYFDFGGTKLGHPRTLDAGDVEPARAAGAHFARKWDLARTPDAFALMDQHVFST